MKAFLWGVLLVSLFSVNVHAKKKVLITSFEAFEGREKNNSSLVSEELKRLFKSHPNLANDYSLEILVLPVQGRTAPTKAKAYIQNMKEKPDLVLSLGESSRLASQKKTIEINFTAYNKHSSSSSKKNSAIKLYPSWDDSESMNFPVAQMYCALNEEDRRWIALEDSIGSYVCNETAFDLSLFLKNNSMKDARVKQIVAGYEAQKTSKAKEIQDAADIEIKDLQAKYDAQRAITQAIKKEIESSSHLLGEYTRYLDDKDREREERERVERERANRSSQRQPYTPPNDAWRNYRQGSSNGGSNYAQAPQPQTVILYNVVNINNYHPKIGEYINALSLQEVAQNNLNYRITRATSEISTATRGLDAWINATQSIGKDTYRTSQEPYYGFIHIPILQKSSKTNPLEIAQLIALMVRGVFEQNYKQARVDYQRGVISCGVDNRVVASKPYQNIQKQIADKRTEFNAAKDRLKTKYTKNNLAFASDEDFLKFAKNNKNDFDCQTILRLSAEIDALKLQLSNVVITAPSNNAQKGSFFSGHEKYQPQGTYNPASAAKNLLRLGFQSRSNKIPVPAEIDFTVKLDSNQNVVLLLKNQNGQQKLVPLKEFEAGGQLSLTTISAQSDLRISLDNSKSYAKYDLRDLKAEGIKYDELNARIEYFINLDYSYPVMKIQRMMRQELVYSEENPNAPPYNKVTYYDQEVWETARSRIPLVLKYNGKKWEFSVEGKPLNMLLMSLEMNKANTVFISQIESFDLPEAKPQAPAPAAAPVAQNFY